MTIQERLTDAMKTAMKAQDSLRLNAIRMARTAIKNAEIEARGALDDAGVIKVLSTLVKQRREAADAYRDTRPELVITSYSIHYTKLYDRPAAIGGEF